MKTVFDINNKESFRVINQTGVTQNVVSDKTLHNATWDSILTPDGRLFLSLCSELTTSEYAKLAEYDLENDRLIEHFYSKDYIMPDDRHIRDSKFHTGFAITNENKLIMATHTTDKSPEHPAWMPHANYGNPWQGYPGSSLLTYDLETKQIENLGIPVKRETLYGGAYDKKHNNYYMLGFIKGHLYRYDLDERKVYDLGKTVEKASYRMIVGKDDNIYFATRNGLLKRINVDTQQVENLKQTLPNSSNDKKLNRAYLTAAINGLDNKIYMAGQFHNELTVYNPEDNSLVSLGAYMPYDSFMEGYPMSQYIGGMDFDKEGVLWYVVCNLRLDVKEDFCPGIMLMKWDVLKDKVPSYLGIVGTEQRASVRSAGIFIDKEKDVLYIPGTNHAADGTEITIIDLSKFRKKDSIKGPICKDEILYPENKKYISHDEMITDHWDTINENPYNIEYKDAHAFTVWKHLDKENTKIESLIWNKESLYILLKNKQQTVVVIDNKANLIVKKALKDFDQELQTIISTKEYIKPNENEVRKLSYYPGRQYLSYVDKIVKLKDTDLLVSKDGYLAITNSNSIFNLGPVGNFGSVHDLTINSEKTRVYGVAGDVDDLNLIFSFDVNEGVKKLGFANLDNHFYGSHFSSNLGSVAFDSDKGILAVGSYDEMATVYLYKL